MKTAFALIVALTLATSAHASDTKWLALAIAGHSADYLSSVYFSTKEHPCQEANPLARHPDRTFDARKGAVGLAATVGIEWLVLKATRGKSEHVRIFGQSLVIGGGVAGSAFATNNMIGGCKGE